VWRRGGPGPYLRMPLAVRVAQATEAHRLHETGLGFVEVAERMGCSVTTAWRRARWWEDWTLWVPNWSSMAVTWGGARK
jgi:hypothetical protein